MATLKPELKAILDRYGINWRDQSQCWDCHGVIVLYHKAYEVIAAKEGITFDPPQIIEANGAAKLAAICVTGRMGDRAEWSIGEASELNYRTSGKQAPYPWAMAEKRAKDRVIAKLVGLAQYVYSEDEADEFKNGERKTVEGAPCAPAPSPAAKTNSHPAPAAGQAKADTTPINLKTLADVIKIEIDAADGLAELNTDMMRRGEDYTSSEPKPDSDLAKVRAFSENAYRFLIDRANKRRSALANQPQKQVA